MSEKSKDQLPILILKFTDFPDDLLNGRIRMNNLKKYIDIEKNDRKKGQGDLMEASRVYRDLNLTIHDNETDEIFFTLSNSDMTFIVDGDEKKPVFCTLLLTSKHFKYYSEDDDHITYILQINNDEIEHMLENFPQQLVVIPAPVFFNRMNKTAIENNYHLVHRPVIYDDFNENNFERIKSYDEDHSNVFFWKDRYFEKQNEYRFVILNKEVDDYMHFEIGSLHDVGFKYNANDFFKGKVTFKTRKVEKIN